MTCIIGMVTDDGVIIGGDSAGVDHFFNVTPRKDEKVFKVENFLFGAAGSFRIMDILRYQFDPPKYYEEMGDEREFIISKFIPKLRAALKENGYMYKENEVEELQFGCFILGFRKRLFTVWGDLQVGEPLDGYDAMGTGAEFAIGAMSALYDYEMKPEMKIKTCLQIAAKYQGGVCPPFNIIKNY